jgi:hypothetical protein
MSLNLPASSQAPTIGRKVWLWIDATELENYNILDARQALDATIVFVKCDGTVTLDVVDHTGSAGVLEDVQLYDYSPEIAHGHDYEFGTLATWMPYRVKKHKEEAGMEVVKASHNQQEFTDKVAYSDTPGAGLVLTDGKDV